MVIIFYKKKSEERREMNGEWRVENEEWSDGQKNQREAISDEDVYRNEEDTPVKAVESIDKALCARRGSIVILQDFLGWRCCGKH